MNNRLQKIINIFLQKVTSYFPSTVQNKALSLFSKRLGRKVTLDIMQVRPYLAFAPARLLLINDGQDFAALNLLETIDRGVQKGTISNLIVVGIKAGDRMQEYGTEVQADYAGRGAKAKAYSAFVAEELLPFLYQQFSISPEARDHAFAGFSLGGLSALDIVWNHPDLFGSVGVFSGSLWWRSTPFDPKDPDADRIMHQQISIGPKRPGLRFWLQTGTHDEEGDRNNNGVIDAIDDTLDLIEELENLGYEEGREITYVEVDKGEHNPQTWGKVMPEFLDWYLCKE